MLTIQDYIYAFNVPEALSLELEINFSGRKFNSYQEIVNEIKQLIK